MCPFIQRVLAATVFAMLILHSADSVADDSPEAAHPSDEVSAAVQKSLKYLDERGQWWLDKKKCVSCHRTAFVSWTMRQATDRGLSVSGSDLARWQSANLEKPGGKGNLEGISQLILGRVPDPIDGLNESPDASAVYDEFAQLLIDNQQPDGSWKAGGQLPRQKRPEAETQQVSVMWNVLALESLDQTDERRKAISQARSFLQSKIDDPEFAAPKSIEWYALQVALVSSSDDSAKLSAAIEKLLDLQNSDGGWGWMSGEKSHAMSTGLAVYFLHRSSSDGQSRVTAATRKATGWLLDNQEDNGAWPSTGTKANAKGKVVETSTYWSSAWAVLGLIESLPSERSVSATAQ